MEDAMHYFDYVEMGYLHDCCDFHSITAAEVWMGCFDEICVAVFVVVKVSISPYVSHQHPPQVGDYYSPYFHDPA